MLEFLIMIVTFCRVPNIKFNVAKVLQSLIPIVEHSVSSDSGILVGLVVGWFPTELWLVHLSVGPKIDSPLNFYWPIWKNEAWV